ncbi:MAG: hypothetical protein ACI9XZ_000753 [Alphaproteobacteria bacterium]|jgi:hypothetical protein
MMEPSATAQATRSRSWLQWPTEQLILKWIFRLLLVSTITFLGFDYMRLTERASEPLPGIVEREQPLVMTPPKQRDQIRPYLPKTTPRRRSGKPPVMPGYAKPPSHKLMAAEMVFTRGPKGQASAVGRIEPGSAERFAQFIESQAGEITTLHLHSPGGSVSDALAMSKLIRAKNITTIVGNDAYCASSCPIVLSGGTKRLVGKTAWVGVHQVFAAGRRPGSQTGGLATGLSQGQTISARVQQHLVDMGISPEAWLHAMRTPSDQLYVFTTKEMLRYKLASKLLSR